MHRTFGRDFIYISEHLRSVGYPGIPPCDVLVIWDLYKDSEEFGALFKKTFGPGRTAN